VSDALDVEIGEQPGHPLDEEGFFFDDDYLDRP
jgi:hypothetical protein